MRILHTCLRYPPASGGVETYVKEIVDRTRRVSPPPPAGGLEGDQEGVRFSPLYKGELEGVRDVRVLTSSMRTHGPVTELNPELLIDDPMHVQRLHHIATPFISYPRLQALDYYIGHHKPDILHSYSFWYQPADVAARYAKHHNIPFIFHPMYYENDTRQKPKWQLYKRTYGRQTFNAADIVAVISPFEQSLIEKAGFPIKRFELIPPGIDTQLLAQPTENIFQQKGITGTNLLTVSRIAPGKGLEDVIGALPQLIKKHPDLNLIIVGEDFGIQEELTVLAQAKGIGEHIHFLGHLSRQDLISAYQHADLFIHPSRYEAFGIVVAEALAAGTPVVARNTSAIPFVAPHNKAALLFNNQDELVSHIDTLITNQNTAKNLAEFGRQHVTRNFNWNSSIKKILSLYDELT